MELSNKNLNFYFYKKLFYGLNPFCIPNFAVNYVFTLLEAIQDILNCCLTSVKACNRSRSKGFRNLLLS